MRRTKVKFTRYWRGYNTNQVAGFDHRTAEQLVASGYAEAYDSASAANESTEGASGNPEVKSPMTAALTSTPSASGAAVDAPDQVENLSELKWTELQTRAAEIAKARGKVLTEDAGGRSRELLTAYVRKYRDLV